jgi:hypothetical protein
MLPETTIDLGRAQPSSAARWWRAIGENSRGKALSSRSKVKVFLVLALDSLLLTLAAAVTAR